MKVLSLARLEPESGLESGIANPDTLPNRNRVRLWEEALRYAFPHTDDPDGSVTFWRVAHLHRLRNRVSHVEPLLDIDVKAQIREAFDLVASINPAIATWLSGISKVSATLAKQPHTNPTSTNHRAGVNPRQHR